VLKAAPGYSQSTPVAVINGDPRTWAQMALIIGLACRTLDKIREDIVGLDEWYNCHYNYAGYEVGYIIPVHSQQGIAHREQVVNVPTLSQQQQQQVAILAHTRQQQQQVAILAHTRQQQQEITILAPTQQQQQQQQVTVPASMYNIYTARSSEDSGI